MIGRLCSKCHQVDTENTVVVLCDSCKKTIKDQKEVLHVTYRLLAGEYQNIAHYCLECWSKLQP